MFKKEPIEFIFFFGFFTYYFINANKNKESYLQKFQIGEKIKVLLNKKYKTGYILSYDNKNNTYLLETGKKHPSQNMIHKNINEDLIKVI